MDTLVATLKSIEESGLPYDGDRILRHRDHDQIYLAEAYATTLFVTEEGTPHFAAMDDFYEMYGYIILPGDRTRFGSVTGAISTKKGFIVFG
jgi:hypothetical protein